MSSSAVWEHPDMTTSGAQGPAAAGEGLHDIPIEQIASLPAAPSPRPMPNFPITGGPNSGV